MSNMMQRIQQFKELFDYKYEIIKERNPDKLGEYYLKAKDSWEKAGYSPLMIFLDDQLLERLEIEFEEKAGKNSKEITAEYIKKSESINPQDFLSISKEEIDSYFQAHHEFDSTPKLELQLCYSFEDYENCTILLVKLPTIRAYEAFSYIFMGGINDCPSPDEQTAIAKYWYEKYKAQPAVIGWDFAEFYVANPPKNLDEVKLLAVEQCRFCSDLSEQVFSSYESVADHIYDNIQWFFWWD